MLAWREGSPSQKTTAKKGNSKHALKKDKKVQREQVGKHHLQAAVAKNAAAGRRLTKSNQSHD